MSERPVIFLPEQNYDCIQCGRGCFNPWNIKVEKPCVEALQGSELLRRVTAEHGEPFAFHEERQVYHLNRKPNGQCVFLTSEGPRYSCSIHAELGYDAKPTTCKNFPFIVVESPEEVRVAGSYYCSAVQQNSGRPLAEHHEALSDFPADRRLQVGHRPIPVFEDITMDWDGYKVLLQFLKMPRTGESMETLLSRGLLGLTRSFLKTPAGGGIDSWALMEELQGTLDILEKAPWFQQQMQVCLHGITLFIDCSEPEEIQALAPVLFAGGELTLPGCHWRGTVEQLVLFRSTPLPEELQKVVDRYLKAVLFRHYLGTHVPLLQALICLYLCSALIRQYSRLLAGAAGERLGPTFLYAALDRCEHDLMYHGKGFEKLWASFAQALAAGLAL